MVDLNPNISVIIANVTGLNTLEDKGCSGRLKKKTHLYVCCLQEIYLVYGATETFKAKRYSKYILNREEIGGCGGVGLEVFGWREWVKVVKGYTISVAVGSGM